MESSGWSQSKMSRIENGAIGVSLTGIMFLLNFYGVVDEQERQRLLAMAR